MEIIMLLHQFQDYKHYRLTKEDYCHFMIKGPNSNMQFWPNITNGYHPWRAHTCS